MVPWIIIVVLVLIIILGLLAVFIIKQRKEKHKPDYYTFFIMGIIWLPFGVIIGNTAFTIMGLIFAIIGLVHRGKWKKNHKTWKQLSQGEKQLKRWIIIGLSILVFVGLVMFFLNN
ncbi:MAG: hypothetical protein KJ674_00440 [Nanoarchaeota archaeon]|nr:hypothetical protein [Nanoarchaeota archaeon]